MIAQILSVLMSSALSSWIAIIISRNTAKSEINKQKAASFLDKLTSRRIECYPHLYAIISNIIKVMKNEPLGEGVDRFGVNFLKSEMIKVNRWDNENSVFLGSSSIKHILRMKAVIYRIINEYDGTLEKLSCDDKTEISSVVGDLELSLKNDIGIFPLENISGQNKIPTYGEIDKL